MTTETLTCMGSSAFILNEWFQFPNIQVKKYLLTTIFALVLPLIVFFLHMLSITP